MPDIRSRRVRTVAVIAAALSATTLAACSSSGSKGTGTSAAKSYTCPTSTSGNWNPTTPAPTTAAATTSSGGTVNLVAYSVPKPAYSALTTAFNATTAGKGVDVQGSYGPSGTQEKAVAGGQKADYVGFSTGSDMSKLVPSKVSADWNAGATKGIISDSVVVIAVRPGNPKHICGWNDLIKSGVKIVTPDPASSGSAKWNILAAYEHVLQTGGTAAEAQAYLKKFFANVVVKAASGAVATQQFLAGTGDALISYENEAIDARQAGKPLDYVVPAQSILIENPAAVTKTANTSAKNFLAFAQSAAGQKIFAENGFRPVVAGAVPSSVKGANSPASPFPNPQKLITISQLGGWSSVNDTFFGTNGIVTKIES